MSEQIRHAIEVSDMSRYRICKIAGVCEASFSRFMRREGGLSMDSLDRLGQVLSLVIAVEDERTGRLAQPY